MMEIPTAIYLSESGQQACLHSCAAKIRKNHFSFNEERKKELYRSTRLAHASVLFPFLNDVETPMIIG